MSSPAQELATLRGPATASAPADAAAARAAMRRALAEASAVVLREMRRHRGWAGAPDTDLEDALHNAVLALLEGPALPPERVLMSLRAAVRLRRLNYWHVRRNRPAGRAVELTGDVADTTVDEHTVEPTDTPALSAPALMPYAADCLAELSETQVRIYALIAEGEREVDIAKTLGLDGRNVVQKERHAAEHKIAMFAQVVAAGRVCGKRAVAISEYAAGTASPDNVRRAEAHLASCEPCARAFRATERELGRQVAALIPTPAVLAAVATHRPGGSGAAGLLERLVDLIPGGGGSGRLATIRETAIGFVVRSPGSVETVAGAGIGGAGVAAGTKIVVGLCAVVIAGGGAVCSSLGVLPDGLNVREPAKEHKAAAKPKAKAKRASSQSTTSALYAPSPAPTIGAPATRATSPDPAVAAAAAAKARAERKRKARQARARAARASARNPLQSPTPAAASTTTTGAASTTAPPATPPPAPQLQPERRKPASDPNATPSPALTGGSNPLQGRTP